MEKSKKSVSVRTVVFNEMREESLWGTRSLVENDPIWDYDEFIKEVNNWSFEKMMEGLDLDYNGEGYAFVA